MDTLCKEFSSNPNFSIVTITFNHLKGLMRTYESIIAQTYKDYEWIVIDGGSSDGSKDFLIQHQKNISYWCSEPDNGVYHAMNKGIKHAHGDYLIFMNSGDSFYNPDVLQNVVNLNCTSDILSGLVYYQDDGKQMRWYHDNVFIQLYEDTLNHQGSFIKKIIFDKFGGFDESYRIVSDWKFFLDTIVFGDATFQYTTLPIALQERGGISLNTKYNEVGHNERQEVLSMRYSRRQLREIARYDKYENCRAAQRAVMLVQRGGIAEFLAKAFMKLLDKLFLKESL